MALSTYSDLKTSIENYIARDDLSSYVDDFIDLAEARHKNELRFIGMLQRDAITISTRHTSFPSNFLEAKELRLLTSPVTVLRQIPLHTMSEVRTESSGRPAYFTIHADIEVDVGPDTSYSGELIFYEALTALSDSNTSNALLTRSPGCYLFAALAESAPFLMHDERIQVWEQKYTQAASALYRQEVKSKKAGHFRPLIVGGTP